MLRRNRERITQRLSGSVYSLTSPGGKRIFPWLLGALLVCACLAAYAVSHAPPPVLETRAEFERMQQELDRLQHEIKLGELRLQQEIMTREELVRQMDAQSQKLRQAEQELQFFRGQKDKLARDKTPHNQ